ncbi:hypothetical protein [Arundinibacter roseus]|uniref:Uncharacterized protein n=1 Tax=Arundinibacter roseus TaxID=2070510 RepID=A0A4R4JWR0_9BACT|nr:hypothetical protein [Arundinibacter roseus]TDB58536.1 hypothetical protein EZE20_23020 [Arundinibacter roseus]
MAKEKLGLKETLGLSPRQNIKKTVIDVEKTEKAVKELHSTGKKEITRLSVDIDKELFKKMKVKLAQEGMTVRDYVLSLIEADILK